MHLARFVALLLCLLTVPLSAPSFAQDKFPNRPIRFVVGFSAGWPNDIVARIMCDWLTPHLGQPCVVENRVGTGGMLATQAVINSPPDGYTILFIAPNHAIGASLYKNLQFVFTRDSQPLAGMMNLTNVMVVPPSLPVKNVAEFIAHAKANPGKLSYASSGNGTSVHMSAELFKMMAGLDMTHVPYRGAPPLVQDLIGGHILFDWNLEHAAGSLREHVHDGRRCGERQSASVHYQSTVASTCRCDQLGRHVHVRACNRRLHRRSDLLRRH